MHPPADWRMPLELPGASSCRPAGRSSAATRSRPASACPTCGSPACTPASSGPERPPRSTTCTAPTGRSWTGGGCGKRRGCRRAAGCGSAPTSWSSRARPCTRCRIMAEAHLVARHLSCRVPDRKAPGGSRLILDDVSLVVRPREFVCILGPSGCGKSTLLLALSARRAGRRRQRAAQRRGSVCPVRILEAEPGLRAAAGCRCTRSCRWTSRPALHGPAAVARRRVPAARSTSALDEMLDAVHLTALPVHPDPAAQRRPTQTGQLGQRGDLQPEPDLPGRSDLGAGRTGGPRDDGAVPPAWPTRARRWSA